MDELVCHLIYLRYSDSSQGLYASVSPAEWFERDWLIPADGRGQIIWGSFDMYHFCKLQVPAQLNFHELLIVVRQIELTLQNISRMTSLASQKVTPV